MTNIRVVLADDHPVVRNGVRNLLEKTPDIVVVGEAKSGTETLHLVKELTPDVLLLDIELKDMTGIAIAERLCALASPVRILVLSSYDEEEYIYGVLASGAAGYLLKEEAVETIVDAVRGVARGEKGWLSRRVTAKVATWLHQNEAKPQKSPLTEREIEVMQLLARGETNEQIASSLKITERTVRFHLRNIATKLQLTTRGELIVWAVKESIGYL